VDNETMKLQTICEFLEGRPEKTALELDVKVCAHFSPLLLQRTVISLSFPCQA
jgi:hypothetical protein